MGKRKQRACVLEVHTGPMKSAKTLHLIQACHHAQAARRGVQAFRPSVDTRDIEPVIRTRFGDVSIPATFFTESREILDRLLPETRLVIVDEAQFCDEDLPEVVRQLLETCDVCVSGLDLDYLGRPFGTIPMLLAMADTVHKHKPVCDVCGATARITQRLTNGRPSKRKEPAVMPEGSMDTVVYETRCRRCHIVPKR